MTTNPTPVRGEVWRIRFDPTEGDEIKKVRTAVVISENAVGRLRLKIVVPITEWKPRYASYPWFVHPAPTPTNGLTKDSGPGNRAYSGRCNRKVGDGNGSQRPLGADCGRCRRLDP
jgi:hypothetical protein